MRKKVIDSLKLITFDATGTLVQFRKPPVQIYMEFALKNGIATDEDKMKKAFRKQWKVLSSKQPHFGVCWRSWWTEFVVGTFKESGVTNVDESTLNSIAAQLIENFQTTDCWELKPGTLDLLSQLSELKDVRIGVISNFDPRLRKILNAVGISEYLEFCILSHEKQISKPTKEIFLKAMEASKLSFKNKIKGTALENGIVAGECIHVGDNYELDFIGATSAGWKAALLVENIDDIKVDLPLNSVFTSMSKFQNYLFS